MRFSPREFLLSWWPPHLRRVAEEAEENARIDAGYRRDAEAKMTEMQRHYGRWVSERYTMPELRIVEPCREYAFPVLVDGPVFPVIHEERIKMETFVCHWSIGLPSDIAPELIASRLGAKTGRLMEDAILARYRSKSALLKGAA